MFIVLVGPKGSGKSHIGRLLELDLGVHFFHVEPLWMEYYAECRAAGRDPSITEGIFVVHPKIAKALGTHEHLCVETTGASPEILDDLLSLTPSLRPIVARVHAPLDLCIERIASRDPCDQIPMADDAIRKIYELSVAAEIVPTLVIDNTAATDAEIVSAFESALTL